MTAIAELERNAVGSLLLDPSRIDDAGELLTPFDFLDQDLGALHELLCNSHAAGIDVSDPSVVLQEARKAGLSEQFTTPAGLVDLYTKHKSSNAVYYATQVKRASRKRQLESVGRELVDRAAAPNADPDEIAKWLEAQTSAASAAFSRQQERWLHEAANDYFEQVANPQFQQGLVHCGIPDVDECVGGWHAGELVILAARPGIGKTAFALNWAKFLAERSRTVFYASLEMADQELAGRILCRDADVNNRLVRSGQCEQEHVHRLQAARDRIQKANERLSIWSPPTATVDQIRARAKRVQAMHGLDMLIVDYVGLVQSKDRRLKKWEHISQVSRELKSIAKELSVPVLALAQLNREADGQEPRLSQLRDSGALEQDADAVIFLHANRDATETFPYSSRVQATPEERQQLYKNEVRLIVAKHRHGETMWLKLRWIPERTEFREIPTLCEWEP